MNCPECGCVIREERQRRSQQTHNHYFAAIHDAWQNLPEAISGEFPSPQHLRAYALIRTGYCTTTKIVCRTNRDAIDAIRFVTDLDEFALGDISDNVATIYRPQSQSFKAMGRDMFRKSKEDVLGFLSQLIGADVAQEGKAA